MQYRADELLAKLQEEAIRQGIDPTPIRQRFVKENTFMGQFNGNLRIDLGGSMTPESLLRFYATNAAASGTPSLPTGASVATRKSGSTTSYPVAAIDRVIAEGNEFIFEGDKIVKSVQGLAREAKQEATTGKSAALAAGAAGAKAVETAGSIKSERIDYINNVMNQMGLSESDPASLLQTNVQQLIAADKQLTTLEPKLQQLRSVNLLDGPLEWIGAQIELQRTADAYNGQAQVFNNSAARIGRVQQLANTQQNMRPGINTDRVRQQAAEEAEERRQSATVQAIQVGQQARSAQLSAYSTAFQFQNVQFSHAHQIAKLLGERQSWAELDTASQAAALELENVNIRREMAGLRRLTPEQFKTMDAKERTMWIEAGSRTTLDFGDTPGRAMNFLLDTQSYSKFKENMPQVAQNFYDDLINEARYSKLPALRIKFPKAKEEDLFALAIDEKFKEWDEEAKSREFNRLSPSNPRRMNAAVFASSDKLDMNPIAKFVRATPNEGAGLSEADILTYAAELARSGKPVSQVAAMVGEFFRRGYETQAAAYRLPLVGVKMNNPANGNLEYPMQGDVYGWMQILSDPRKTNSVKPMNMFNEASIENFLSVQIARNVALEAARSAPDPLRGVFNP